MYLARRQHGPRWRTVESYSAYIPVWFHNRSLTFRFILGYSSTNEFYKGYDGQNLNIIVLSWVDPSPPFNCTQSARFYLCHVTALEHRENHPAAFRKVIQSCGLLTLLSQPLYLCFHKVKKRANIGRSVLGNLSKCSSLRLVENGCTWEVFCALFIDVWASLIINRKCESVCIY